MSGYVKTFKERDKDKDNKLMFFCTNDEKKFKKYKTIWTKMMPVYDNRYMKTKIKTYGDYVYTDFCGLNVPVDDIEWEYFTVISIDSLLVYKNKYSL